MGLRAGLAYTLLFTGEVSIAYAKDEIPTGSNLFPFQSFLHLAELERSRTDACSELSMLLRMHHHHTIRLSIYLFEIGGVAAEAPAQSASGLGPGPSMYNV